MVKVSVGDSLYKEYSFNSNGLSYIKFPLGKIYYCVFYSENYAPKTIVFNLKDNLDLELVSKTKEFNYVGLKIKMINIKKLPENLIRLLTLNDESGRVIFKEKYFEFDLEYGSKIKEELEKINRKADILENNPELRIGFAKLDDSIKSNILNLKKLNLELILTNQLRINQEQKTKELALLQRIERDQFLTQKKLNESAMNQQKALALSKQKELELANQEKKNKQLEIENATYTKNAFLGLAVFIAIVSLLLLRAYFIKRNSNNKLHKQNELIAEQKQEITDSIQYAQRIQFAILPTKENITKAFPQSFVLFKPKDIVSGDFYWFQEVDNKKYIAACDCTGHGVPGALMSMVATDMLNDALVHSKKVDEILALTNRSIKTALKQSNDDDSTRDGMDLALCCFDDQTNILKYAGAYRPLWLIRHAELDSASSTNAHDADFKSSQNIATVGKIAAQGRNDAWELIEYKATKAAIGGLTEDNQVFQLNEIQLQKGDTIYLSSDGYADQFSPIDKKLMTKRFKEILLSIQHLTMLEQEQYLAQFIDEWRGIMEQTDDVLVIGVRV